jgi:hypothetical protein
MAGYHAALGLAQLAVLAESWQRAFALLGAIAVGATAWARLALSIAPDTGLGDAARASSLFPRSELHDADLRPPVR